MGRVSRWPAIAVLAVWLAAVPAAADGKQPARAGEQAVAIEVEPPPEALLEFLGSWEAGDDEWMGPEFFEALEAAEQELDHDQNDHD